MAGFLAHIKVPTEVVIKLIFVLKDELIYVAKYGKILEELEHDFEVLKKVKENVLRNLEAEEGRYGKEVYNDFGKWLDEVEKISTEYNKFEAEYDRAQHCAGCTLGTPVNPVIRWSHGKTGQDMKGKVGDLLQAVKDVGLPVSVEPPSTGFAFSNVEYQSFGSRRGTLDKIRVALSDSSVRMIGVHGPACIGKTTLVIEAANKARKNLFSLVIMVSMKKGPDIREIQQRIADMLGMELEDESEQMRALRIQEKLSKDKENTLIILDDFDEKVDLNLLGIPFDADVGRKNLRQRKSLALELRDKIETTEQVLGPDAINDEEEHYIGCKVLLISEVKSVLRQMNVDENAIVLVNPLDDKEAEYLFMRTVDLESTDDNNSSDFAKLADQIARRAETVIMKMAEINDKNSEKKKLAAQIARMCAGLPISIVTTARALKDQSLSVWKETCQHLEKEKLSPTRISDYSVRLSYRLLQDEDLKRIFLLCARMGHDALVADSVKYYIGLGFIQGMPTVREARDRVQTSLAKLKHLGLLSESHSSDRFRMQDLVRTAALSIASEENNEFMLTEEELDEWPNKDKLKRYTTIVLQRCRFIHAFPESINCPRLRVFHLDNSQPDLKIPDGFFKQMKELRVLILTGIHLSQLPQSIGCLTKLKMLCLEQCTLRKRLHIIGELKNLRILSFSGSLLKSLPNELKKLSQLQILDISNCSKLKVIPPNVISHLINLENLYMRNISVKWRVNEGHESHYKNANLSELGHLNMLTNLDIQIPFASYLPENVFLDNLYNYKIVIGTSTRDFDSDFKMPEKYELTRFLAIQQQKYEFDIHSQKTIKMLLEKVEVLWLENPINVKDMFHELNLKGFPCLRYLSIANNSEIESLIKSNGRNRHFEKAFPELKSLNLYQLNNLVEICSCRSLSPSSFCNLKIIKIKLCGQLKNVFLVSTVEHLKALETIQVSECNSLEVIVPTTGHIQKTDKGKLEFPELRTLTLQSLPNLVGFDPDSSNGEGTTLFHGKVDLSKLKRMELSSIQIHQIWTDDHCSQFQNLTHLDVNNCGNLKYLFSLSVAKNLGSLQSLFVSECWSMKNIFSQGQHDRNNKVSIFPSLKIMKLSNMKSLDGLWSSKLHSGSFGNLATMVIEKCDKFVNIFPQYMVRVFQRLRSIRVINCKSVNTILDLVGKRRYARRVSTKLHDIHLETLPKLKHLLQWKKGRERTLELKNLQKIWVCDCDGLENIFSFSTAKTLENLKYLTALDCFQLRYIVAKREDAKNCLMVWVWSPLRDIVAKRKDDDNNNSPNKFEFPNLDTIKFSELPKYRSFYPKADYNLSCPALKNLSIGRCVMLEPTGEKTLDDEPTTLPVTLSQEDINKLKSTQIELWPTKSPPSNYDYRRDNLEKLRLSKLKDPVTLFWFLCQNPNLRSLWLSNCSLKDLVPLERYPEIDRSGVVPKLKKLKLTNVQYLERIDMEQNAVIFRKIESLILMNCCLRDSILHSSVSLGYLANLEVVNCKQLVYLMPLSTVRCLSQLKSMKVTNCESLIKILFEQEESEVEPEQIILDEKIVFKQLKAIELISLKNLKCFSSFKRCIFQFPALDKYVVSACPKMKRFSEEVPSTPNLQRVYIGLEEDKRWFWQENLQATIKYIFYNKKYFESMDSLSVSEHPDLEGVWLGKNLPLPEHWFCSLTSLKLEDCKFGPYAIPSFVLYRLSNLKKLHVRKCYNLVAVFQMDDDDYMIQRATFQLKEVILDELPNVTHIWVLDKQEVPGFHNLQQMKVYSCAGLEMLFPLCLAKNLKKLEKLDVRNCLRLKEIVGKEEEAAAEETFVFPSLTKLKLIMLPHLAHFYSEDFKMECSFLNVIRVNDCKKFELFRSPQDSTNPSTSISGRPLFLDTEGISEVTNLSLNWKDTRVLWSRLARSGDQSLQHLRELYLCLGDDENNEISALSSEIVNEKVPTLEAFAITESGSLEELVPSQNLINKMISMCRVLKNLQELSLDRLSELRSIAGLENLTKLRILSIRHCHGLQCLFTPSIAKKLKFLEEIYVKDCQWIREIVTVDGIGVEEETIRLENLKRISLKSLSSLECFYLGDAALLLPSLFRLDLSECHNMTSFSRVLRLAEGSVESSSRRIQVSYNTLDDDDDDYDDGEYDVLVFPKDLNIAVQWSLLHKSKLHLADHAELKKIWLGEVQVSKTWSCCMLRYLVIEGCDFQLNVVLPSHLIPFLSNLEELVVRKCNSIEAIFDVKGTTADDNIVILLKKLTLEHLPTLKHIWKKDPKDNCPNFLSLEEVIIEECENIRSLFPISTVKDSLNKLEVRNCEKLVEMLTKDEGTKKAANRELIMLSKLISMKLWDLPNLKYICSEKKILNCLALKDLDVYCCPKLKKFTDFQKSPDDLPTDNQGNISVRKVAIPNLECLSLDKKELNMIEKGSFDVNFKKLKSLRLQCFIDESHATPNIFFSKMSAPNMEKFGVMDSAFEEIFPSNIDCVNNLSKLKGLVLRNMPKLKSIGLEHNGRASLVQNLEYLIVWECNSLTNLVPSTVSFSKLCELDVKDCAGLKYLFTSLTSKAAIALEKISISNCDSLEKVVADEKGDKPDEDVIFRRLKKLSLRHLPKLESFYTGASTLSFSRLVGISITRCKSMKMFSHGNVEIDRQYYRWAVINEICWYGSDLNTAIHQQFKQEGSSGEHIVNSHPHGHLHLSAPVLDDHHHLKKQWLGKASTVAHEYFSSLKSLEVEGFHFFSKAALPSHLLPFLNNLEELIVRKCDYVETIFEVIDTTAPNGGGLNKKVVIPLKKICLEELPKLRHILNKDPKGVLTLPNLEQVVVDHCDKILSLFPTSCAKSLVALERMYISNCKSIKSIVDGKEGDIPYEDVTFEKLTTLSFSNLPKLESFYMGKSTTLNFPCLKYFCITECKDMKTFSHGDVVATFVSEAEIDGTLWYGNDLNAALHKQYEKTSCCEDDNINSLPHGFYVEIPIDNFAQAYPALEGIWLGKVSVPEHWFCTLRSMVVEGCQFLSKAIIPFHLLPFLCHLEKLVVKNCDSVQTIFDMRSTLTHDNLNTSAVSLKILTLEQLPCLRHVWNIDLEESHHLSFPDLEEVIVHECKSITSLFPTSSLKDNLTKLDVRNCVELVEMFAKDKGATQEGNEEVIMFPKLTSLKLWNLPNLKRICSGVHILDWHVLQDLDVDHPQMLKIFATNFPNSPNSYQEGQDRFGEDNHDFVSTRKQVATPNLKHVSLHKNGVIMIEQGSLNVELQNIKTIRLHGYNDVSDVFSYVFFSKASSLPSVEKLGVMDSTFKEIFPSQKPEYQGCKKILSQLKGLELRSLNKLKSIGFEHPWVTPLVENLKSLTVFGCTILTSLAPSNVNVSFSNLSELNVENCDALKCLFTFSIAKSLDVLKKMDITNCKSLETVVAAEDAEDGDKLDQALIFKMLETLSLTKLPRLGSFYAGKSTLNFPCLDGNSIKLTECTSLKTFSHGKVVAPRAYGVEIDGTWKYVYNLNKIWHNHNSGPA